MTFGAQAASEGDSWRRSRYRSLAFARFIQIRRRQFACSLLESGADLHDVRDFLGHAAITTTSRYLQSTPLRLERALEKLEAGFAQDSHKPANPATDTPPKTETATPANLLN